MQTEQDIFSQLQAVQAIQAPHYPRKEYQTAYYQKHREEIIGKQKARNQKRKEEIAEYKKKYAKENKENIRAYQKKYRQENPNKVVKWTQDRYERDPLWTRKNYVNRLTNPEAHQSHISSTQKSRWRAAVAFIQKQLAENKDVEELVSDLARLYTISNRSNYVSVLGEVRPRDYVNSPNSAPNSETVYRPRIRNTVLTQEQIDELTDYALKSGLSTDMELIHTTVTYDGEMKKIDDDRDNKKVDIYTTQSKYFEKDNEDKNCQKMFNNNYKEMKKYKEKL